MKLLGKLTSAGLAGMVARRLEGVTAIRLPPVIVNGQQKRPVGAMFYRNRLYYVRLATAHRPRRARIVDRVNRRVSVFVREDLKGKWKCVGRHWSPVIPTNTLRAVNAVIDYVVRSTGEAAEKRDARADKIGALRIVQAYVHQQTGILLRVRVTRQKIYLSWDGGPFHKQPVPENNHQALVAAMILHDAAKAMNEVRSDALVQLKNLDLTHPIPPCDSTSSPNASNDSPSQGP